MAVGGKEALDIVSLWIKSHQTLKGHPKMKRLTKLLGVKVPQAIGHLHCLWWWAMDYAKDGDLSEYDEIDIAIAAEWEGEPGKLMDALLKCGPGDSFGFLEKDEDGVRIHDWGDYSGKLLAQKEKKKERAQKEDKQEPDSDLERWWNLFWDNYPQNRRINKKRSRSLFESIMKCSEEERRSRIKKISLRLAKYCEECETKEARYIMHPSTWLNAYDWSEPLEDGETVQEETFDLEPRGDYGSLREEDDG